MRAHGQKRTGGRKPAEAVHTERDEERDVPDLLDEMQLGMGKLHIES